MQHQRSGGNLVIAWLGASSEELTDGDSRNTNALSDEPAERKNTFLGDFLFDYVESVREVVLSRLS